MQRTISWVDASRYFANARQANPGQLAVPVPRFRRLIQFGLLLLGLGVHAAAAQTGSDDPARENTVFWSFSAASPSSAAPGSRLVLKLNATVQDGWHVYGLKQPANGPTPLLVTLDKNDIAAAAGAPAGSLAIKSHDPSFGLDTEFYVKPFMLSLPVRIAAHPAAGPQLIPVSVRFQTCNGRICQPPKTVHLSASVNVKAGG